MIVGLSLAPLASAQGRPLARSGRNRLNVASSSSRSYLARLERAQTAAVVQLKRAIPSAQVSRRYQVVLNGLAVELPARRLVDLARLSFVDRLYPSVRFRLALNESPALIGAPALSAATGARGEGVKIAVIDDGVDQSHPFFDSTGYTYPPGYPKGGRRWTTPRVIVARAFPGPGSGRRGRLPVDRDASFHGTHVAGIAAGKSGTTSPGRRTHPPTANLSGVAPRAYIGNYRVFTVPTQVGHVGNTPELVAAFEAAVRDGMDVINLSGGSAETDPPNDALVEATRNAAAAGVVPVIAAGNSRDDFGFGTVGSPGSAPEAITVGAVSNTRVWAGRVGHRCARAGEPQAAPVPRVGLVSRLRELGAGRSDARRRGLDHGLRRAARRPAALRRPEPGSPRLDPPTQLAAQHDRARLPRPLPVDHEGVPRRGLRRRCRDRDGRQPRERGESPATRSRRAERSGLDLDGAYLRDFLVSVGGRASVRFNFNALEAKNGRSGVVTSFSSAGPTAFGHRLKPDVAAPGGEILSSTLPEFAGSPFAPFDGTSMATPHVAGAAALLIQRHPGWSAPQVKSALVSSAGPAWGTRCARPRPRCSSPEAAWSTCSPLTTRRSSPSRLRSPLEISTSTAAPGSARFC